ncbi:M64 family metallopeptidase [Streptomyces sp. NPDC092296]|uniref:M64 family metallopeptidase n=1 Tax=Streptomyces sp. NPDC092296 TaxID=3366012 RepID=UPI0037FD85A7
MPGTAGRRRAPALLALLGAVLAPVLAGGAEPVRRPPVAAGRLVPPPGREDDGAQRGGAAPAVDVRRGGDPRNRITLVLLGDGFTAGQLGLFRAEAERAWRALMAIEPFRTYQRFFNMRRVDIASPVPGVSEQRPPRRSPPSPLRMHFWCDGTARLLCVDERAAVRLAGPVPGPHYVIAIANSARYGGAGGSGVTTLAGGSADAGRIIQHEMGHTLGDLGDEYDSADTDADYPNLAAVDAAAMLRDHVKWWRWLGSRASDGSVVGAYPGANGLYRPTPDSVMRTLGGAYNPPSQEAIIEALYRRVDPVDAVSPAAGPVFGLPRLAVRPVPLAGGCALRVRWWVDGRPVRAQSPDGSWFDPAYLGPLGGRSVTVTATVQDTTDRVRDEAFRARWMTRTVRWTLRG